MKYADFRSWFVLVLGVVLLPMGCSPGSMGGSDSPNDSDFEADAGSSDSSVGWESGAPIPPDDGFGGCTPKTCAELGVECGPIDDGCGKLIDCGGCPDGKACGAETPNVCGVGECIPKTCADFGFECGQQGDGCESILDCGTCPSPEFCGGGGPNKCGRGVNCENLCKQQVTCPGGETTRLKGIVYNPAGTLPLYGALVYVPNAPLEHFPDEVRCGACEDEVSGKPLVVATTNYKGEFTLEDVPVGDDIPLVIQLGRWRRFVTIPKIEACVDNDAPAALTRLPRKHKESSEFDNIPRMAMVTGSADALERVIAGAGIDCSEFKNVAYPIPNPEPARIHYYRRNGSYIGSTSSTPSLEDLLDNPARMAKYDMILLACPSSASNANANDARRKNLADYAAAGGRVFTTHYSWAWLNNNNHGGFHGTADWRIGSSDITGASTNTGYIDTSHPKGTAFADWLFSDPVNASTTYGQITIEEARYKVNSVNPPAQAWITTTTDLPSVQHYTFDTPLSAPEEDRCGRVLFSNFHVTGAATGNFANNCPNVGTDPSAQEKVLQFMMFDLASCALPEAPSCQPLSCDDYGYECGPAGDGCGGILDCGTCEAPEICGGAGPGKCGGGQCAPRTCQQQGIECGPTSDGCGNTIDCGECPAPQYCGGGGPGKCGGIR